MPGEFATRSAGGQFTSAYNFSAQVFGVGNVRFLDSVASRVERYWRAQEYGTRALVGRALGGAFGAAGGGRGARHGQALTPFGEGAGQQFIPYAPSMDVEGAYTSARVARKVLHEQGVRQAKTLGIISRPIEPKGVYAKGAADFDPARREAEVISRLVGELFSGAHGSSSVRTIAEFPDLLSVQVISDVGVGALRQAAGRFNENLRAANRELAIELQDHIASKLELARPGVSTGELRKAILDPRNRIPE